MSSPDYRLRRSGKARTDLLGILRYTGETWGRGQLLVYRDLIENTLTAIRQNPEIGHPDTDLPPTHRTYGAGSHVVIYRIEGGSIWVVRILHRRMNLKGHL